MKTLLTLAMLAVSCISAAAQMTRQEAVLMVRELAPDWTVRDPDPMRSKWLTVYIPEKKTERTWILPMTNPKVMRQEIVETVKK